MGVDRRRWICPLRGHLKGRMQYAPTLPADGTRWPVKWFSTEANGRRAPPSDVRVGAYCIRPRCSRQGTIAPIGQPPSLENILGVDERQAPPLDLSPAGSFERAYAIRPYPTGGWDAVACKKVSDGSEWTTAAIVGRPCRGVLHTPPMFMAENNSAYRISAAIGKHFGGE